MHLSEILKETFQEYKTAPLWHYVLTLGCSMAKENADFKIEYNKDYETKLIETSNVDKIYDLESYHMLIWFKKFFWTQSATLSFFDL